MKEIELGQLVKWEEKLWYFQGYSFEERVDLGVSYVALRLFDFWTGEENLVLGGVREELELVHELPDTSMELKDELNRLGF